MHIEFKRMALWMRRKSKNLNFRFQGDKGKRKCFILVMYPQETARGGDFLIS